MYRALTWYITLRVKLLSMVVVVFTKRVPTRYCDRYLLRYLPRQWGTATGIPKPSQSRCRFADSTVMAPSLTSWFPAS